MWHFEQKRVTSSHILRSCKEILCPRAQKQLLLVRVTLELDSTERLRSHPPQLTLRVILDQSLLCELQGPELQWGDAENLLR